MINLIEKMAPIFFFVVMSAFGSTANAANIEHFTASAFAIQTKTTAGWSVVTGTPGLNTVTSTNGWVDSTNLTAGDSYLIMVWGYHNSSNNNGRTGFRVTHGGTSFTESEGVEETDQTAVTYMTPYFWFTVWTAVAGEDIEVEHYNESGGQTSRVEDVTCVVMNATDLGTSLQYVIQTGGGTLTTTFAAKATLTWTPANNGDTWWIMGYTQANINTITGDAYSARLTIDGTSLTAQQIDGEDNADTPIYGLGWAQTFTNTSKTITVDIRETNGNQEWLSAGVFALRLNFFNNFAINATAASQAIPGGTPGAFQQLASITQTTTGAGSQWLIPAGFINDDNNGRVLAHMQLDNVNLTSLNGGWQPATTDVIPWTGVSVQNWSDAASHTIDLDAQTTNNTAAAGFYRWMAMIRLGPTRTRRVMTAD